MPSFPLPNPAFGWSFYGVLIAFLAVASYTDLRRITILLSTAAIGFAGV